jgi:hypothetical protein
MTLFIRKSIGPTPKTFTRVMFITPVLGARSLVAMAETIIHDKKWGKYTMVWVIFLYRLKDSSFNIKARIMGAGKPITRSRVFSIRVFLIAFQKSRDAKASRKYLVPTQGEYSDHTP